MSYDFIMATLGWEMTFREEALRLRADTTTDPAMKEIGAQAAESEADELWRQVCAVVAGFPANGKGMVKC